MPNRPELMAIGDSIYNGTRSLTTNAEVAQLSVPAQVAGAFGWSFKVPTYPFDVLFNLETMVRQGQFSPSNLKTSVLANAQAWLNHGRWSTDDCFDNVAIAQTTITDQSFLNYSDSFPNIGVLRQQLQSAGGMDFSALVELYEALNVSFILNPANDPASEWATRTPLQNVAAREPRRLLVNIGINDGIWEICLLADKNGFNPNKIATGMHDLGLQLLAMRQAGQVDNIYFNLLPKPSCVANLMPRGNPIRVPPGSDYFTEYLSQLAPPSSLSGTDMKGVDDSVMALNARIRNDLTPMFSAVGGLHFVDAYGLMALHDDKHFREIEENRIWIDGKRYNNRPLQSLAHVGGLYGLDNLHPTSVGYAILARAVCTEIEAVEDLPPVAPIDLTAVLHRDTLLSDVPTNLDFTTLLLSIAVAFGRVGGSTTV